MNFAAPRNEFSVGCVPTSESSKCPNMSTASPLGNRIRMFSKCQQALYRLVCRTKLS